MNDSERFWTTGRVLATAIIVGLAAFWIGGTIIYWGSSVDRLDDREFAEAAEARCEAARTELAELPQAPDAADLADRADQIVDSTAVLAAMVDDLATIAPTGEERIVVTDWLDDWSVYLDDRLHHADRLRGGEDARFAVTAIDEIQVTGRIDQFARANDLPACLVPNDIA